MADTSPERIFATVNGASTRLPDGGRQLIGGWSEDPQRDRAVEYVRADLFDAMKAERDDLLAALQGVSRGLSRFQNASMLTTSEISALNDARSLIEGAAR